MGSIRSVWCCCASPTRSRTRRCTNPPGAMIHRLTDLCICTIFKVTLALIYIAHGGVCALVLVLAPLSCAWLCVPLLRNFCMPDFIAQLRYILVVLYLLS